MTTAPTTRPRRRVFATWAVADVVSVVGSRLSSIAIPWFVLTTTGSATQTGLVTFVQLAPMILSKAFAGPVLDRVGPARAALVLDLASALVTACIPIFFGLGWLSFPMLLVLAGLEGLLRGPADAAKYALVPSVAEAGGQPLERVTGVAGTTERLASTVGLAGGGALIAGIGAPNAVAVTAVGFALSGLLIGFGVGPFVRHVAVAEAAEPGVAEGAQEETGADGYLAQLRDGWTFLRRDPVLLAIALMVAVTNLFDQAWAAVLAPVWAVHHGYGADRLGLVFAVMTGASVLGSLIATVVGHRMPRLAVYTIAFILTGFPRFGVMAFDVPLSAVLGVLAVAGFASGFLNPIIAAVEFERVPRALVGRVSSLVAALAWGLMPFGGVMAGGLVSGFGVAAALLVVGLLYFVASLAPLALPSFRQMGTRTGIPPAR